MLASIIRHDFIRTYARDCLMDRIVLGFVSSMIGRRWETFSGMSRTVPAPADVDNDLFDAGAPDNNNGAAVVNLTYRITALYSGRDEVLGASAGLKHFGTRRLGRAGLAHRPPLVTQPPQTDNVWDVDCSSFFPDKVSGTNIHGAYFVTDGTIELMRQILRGVDRGVLKATDQLVGKEWKEGARAS